MWASGSPGSTLRAVSRVPGSTASRPRALRVPLEGLAPGPRQLDGATARYVQRVHRLGPGDRLSFFDPILGVEADAEIVGSGAGSVDCELAGVHPSAYRAYPISLLQALAKGSKPDTTIAEATALGVERIVLLESERAVVRLDEERAAARRVRWQRIAIEAARQCGRGKIPVLHGPLALMDVLPQVLEPRRLLLAAGGAPLLERLADWQPHQAVALLVGPEGGLSAQEVERALGLGFLPASLGPTTLRSELAGVAALGALVAFAALRGVG